MCSIDIMDQQKLPIDIIFNMNMKRIIIIACFVIIFLILFFCLSNHATNLNGVRLENGTESNVNITVKNKRIDKILNRMSGNVCIQTEDNKTAFEYKFSGIVFKGGNCRFTIVYRFYTSQRNNQREDGYESKYESKYEHGYMYFDKELENMVLITEERQVYAADDNFRNIVKQVSNTN